MQFSFRKRLQSFKFAWNGIRYLFSTQHNTWIHLSVTLLVIIAGFVFHVSPAEWCLLIVCIGSVLSMESMNTAIETLADTLHPGKNPGIEKAKDLSAAAVLIISMVAALTGLIIFVPRFLQVCGF